MSTDQYTEYEWAVFFRPYPEDASRLFANEDEARGYMDASNAIFPTANPPAFYLARRTIVITPWEVYP